MPTTEHHAALARAIPDAQLATYQAPTTWFTMEDPELHAGLLNRFLT